MIELHLPWMKSLTTIRAGIRLKDVYYLLEFGSTKLFILSRSLILLLSLTLIRIVVFLLVSSPARRTLSADILLTTLLTNLHV
jgi:hypothetical protein